MMPSLPSQHHVRARWHRVPTEGTQRPHSFPRSPIVPGPQRHIPPQRASPAPQTHLTCCAAAVGSAGARLPPRPAAQLGSGCRRLFKPQIPGAGRQSRRRRGWREGMQSPGPAPGAGTNKRQLCRVSSLCTQGPAWPLGNSPSGAQSCRGAATPSACAGKGKEVRASLGIPITAALHPDVPTHPLLPARSCSCLGGVPG